MSESPYSAWAFLPLSVDDMLLQDPSPRPCIICQSLPFVSESQAQRLTRSVMEKVWRMQDRAFAAEVELIEARARIEHLEEIVERQNVTLRRRSA